jgi:hypothetical protein
MLPGIYAGTPYDEYAAWLAVRASTLNACHRSFLHGRWAHLLLTRIPAPEFAHASPGEVKLDLIKLNLLRTR